MKELSYTEILAVNGAGDLDCLRYMAVTFLSLSGAWAGTLAANCLCNPGTPAFVISCPTGFLTGLAVGGLLIAYQPTDFEIMVYPLSAAGTVSFLTALS